MSYGDDRNKSRGILEEQAIVNKVVNTLTAQGYKVYAKTSTLLEDMQDKIDAYLFFDETTPFINGKTKVAIDVKSGRTLTVLARTGENILEKSKSDYIVFNVEGTLHWREKSKLREWVNANSHRIKDNKKGDGSKWICVIF